MNIIQSVLITTVFFGAFTALAQTKCFIAQEGTTKLIQEGDCTKRHSPCSTFKIAISLMGYNEKILIDETTPTWPFKQHYVDYIERWKKPHNPTLWMENSTIWYSQVITQKIGMKSFKQYVHKFNYGNQDVRGDSNKNNGLTNAWLGNSLKISGQEQVVFIQSLINNQLPISEHASTMTKNLVFKKELDNGWKLYGKTGSGRTPTAPNSSEPQNIIRWFIGWVEKNGRHIAFAHYMEEEPAITILPSSKAQEIALSKLQPFLNE